MYEVKSNSQKGFKVIGVCENTIYPMDKSLNEGTTPVGVLTVALSGCVIMCVRGYYLKRQMPDVLIDAQLIYDSNKFDIKVTVDTTVNEKEKEEIIQYIEKYCTVGKMLDKGIIKVYEIIGK